jgi:protein SCO1/2
MNRRLLCAALATAGGAGIAASLWRDPAPQGFTAAIPDVELVTHEGKSVRFRSDLVAGKVVLINAMFAGCGETCPLVTANLLRVQELLGERVGRDIFMYSFTLWPELETPEILADYARAHGVGPGWLFLTGSKPDLERLRVSLGFYSNDPDFDVLAETHTGTLRYGNARRDRWSGCPALIRPESIVKEVTETIAVG